VYGGTYMLNKADAEVVYDDAGVAIGVKSEGEVGACAVAGPGRRPRVRRGLSGRAGGRAGQIGAGASKRVG
jgi:hypothetical protein